MRRTAFILCLLLILTSCQATKPVFEETATPTAAETAAGTPSPSQAATPEPTEIPTPAPSSQPTPTPASEPLPSTDPESITLEEARSLVERANEVMTHLVGEVETEENTIDDWWTSMKDWKQLAGYTDGEQFLEELKAVFWDDMAEEFYHRYLYETFWTQKGKLYVNPASRDIMGFYYDMDLDTLKFSDTFYAPVSGGEQIRLTAEGFGNGTPVLWNLMVGEENGVWQLCEYGCYGLERRKDERVSLLLGGQEYSFGSEGGPTWWGEPYQVVEEKRENWHYANPCRTEYYPGLKVVLHTETWGGEEWPLTPLTITVTAPGIPTYQGVEVGMTKKEVLALYPQFAVPGYRSWVRNGDGVYLLVYPTVPEPEWGRYILLRFDENQILEEMTLGFNIAN